jgi:putative transposase
LVCRHWSGKHHAVVRGINLITLVWTDGDRQIPCDYRLYDKTKDHLTKNDHFRAMVQAAYDRGFTPECVAFDGWYSSLENLKTIRGYGWRWLTRLKVNRNVNLDRQGLGPVSRTAIASSGTVVHLEGYGLIRVFKIVSRDRDIEYWATNDLAMDELERLRLAERCWAVENYHRGLKQCCGVERAQVRSARAQRNHIGLAIRAFLRLEYHFYTTGVSWYEATTRIIRGAVRAYIANPLYKLP